MNFNVVGVVDVVDCPYLPENTFVVEYFPTKKLKLDVDRFNYKVEQFYYYGLSVPHPGKLMDVRNLLNVEDKTFRKIRLSIKQKERLRRRLDKMSNFRRRERFKELQSRAVV